MSRFSRVLCCAVAAAALLAGCERRGTEPSPDALFERYVALGNSITSGVESEGINDSTQMQAYPVRLAQRAGAPFGVALINRPGCPAPLTGPPFLTDQRVGGAGPQSCAGFQPTPATVQSLAVPGIKIGDALAIPGGAGGLLYNLIFRGRTLVQAMVAANPTLVSVWLGNNDALSAGLRGDPAALTPLADFQRSLDAIADAIAQRTSARDAIWISVVDPLHTAFIQPGAFLWAARQDPELSAWVMKPVNANCAPLTAAGQPNPLARNLVSLRVLLDAGVPEISCADDAPYAINPQEQQAISGRVAEFNAAIKARADAHGWIYIDSNALLEQLRAQPNQIRKCQDLLAAATAEQRAAALRSTCPHTSAPNFFGAIFSFDGVHPSGEGHRILADAIAEALRAKHGIAL